MIRKIKGVIKEYEWGSYEALPALFGYERDNTPQAEAWFTTHPSGCAILENGMSLKDFIQNDPQKLLGEHCFKKFGSDLPLLLKILAVRTPLSIQCHPNKEEAEKGYEKERLDRESGASLDELDFKDPNGKEELFYALSPVTALVGFREVKEIEKDLKRTMPNAFKSFFSNMKTIKDYVKRIFTLPEEEIRVSIDELISNMDFEKPSNSSQFLGRKEITIKAFRQFGYDRGIIFSYLLNILTLECGEAIYINSGIVHSYIFGNGIELTSLSDNSFRGGLTNKKVDISSFMQTMVTNNEKINILKSRRDSFNREVIISPSTTFALYKMDKGNYFLKDKAPSLFIAIKGSAEVIGKEDKITLSQGECCFIGADEKEYVIVVNEEAFQATLI